MGQFIIEGDLDPFIVIDVVKASAMIEDAEAQAILAAPCLAGFTTAPAGETAEALALRNQKIAAVKSILRGAILRWHESGTGALQSQTVGPFGSVLDNRQVRKGMFYPSELEQLQAMCSTGGGGAFTIDTLGPDSVHLPWCNLWFGAAWCSCGVDIAGVPIFETG